MESILKEKRIVFVTNDLSSFPTNVKDSFEGIKDVDEDYKNLF